MDENNKIKNNNNKNNINNEEEKIKKLKEMGYGNEETIKFVLNICDWDSDQAIIYLEDCNRVS